MSKEQNRTEGATELRQVLIGYYKTEFSLSDLAELVVERSSEQEVIQVLEHIVEQITNPDPDTDPPVDSNRVIERYYGAYRANQL